MGVFFCGISCPSMYFSLVMPMILHYLVLQSDTVLLRVQNFSDMFSNLSSVFMELSMTPGSRIIHQLLQLHIPQSWCYMADMLCDDTLKVEGTFNLYPWETKVIPQSLGNKTVQTRLSMAGHTKAPVGVNIFWNLLVWLLKGHLALKAKAKASQGFTQNSEMSICES